MGVFSIAVTRILRINLNFRKNVAIYQCFKTKKLDKCQILKTPLKWKQYSTVSNKKFRNGSP